VFLSAINSYFLGPLLPIVIFGTGFYLCIKLKFFHALHPFKVMSALLRPKSDGMSPFKALSVALAGTLGVGNIAGVASAVAVGGAGAVFWMWVSALVSMVIKYGEIVLAMIYRNCSSDGNHHGGAFYYIRDGLKFGKTSRLFAVICILTSFTLGSIVQVSAASDAAVIIGERFGFDSAVMRIGCGIVLAVLTACTVFGGIGWISDMTVRLIPLLSAAYIGVSLYIIIAGRYMLTGVISEIFASAFDLSSIGGGIGGYVILRSMRYGVSRGLLSNEAGCGTAPTAHAASDEPVPAVQGCFGIFEVFADTILLCSMTAFVILISGCSGDDGIRLALSAYSFGAGDNAGLFLAASVICFAFATLVCWSYYGCEAVHFLGGKLSARRIYLLVYCVITAIAPAVTAQFVWDSADICIGAMTIINCICVCMLSDDILNETKKL